MKSVALLLSSLAGLACGEVTHVAVFPGMSGGNASLTVTTGDSFVLKLSDFRTTGFNWFPSHNLVEPATLAHTTGNVTGGGTTEPPYLNVTFIAGAPGTGKIVLEHYRAWDPAGDKGLAILSLTVTAASDDAKAAITQEFVDEVNSKQSSWTAHVSPRFETATLGDIKALCGTFMKGEPGYVNELEEKHEDATWLLAAAIPADFDVRTQWPKCANVSGDIRDQSACGSCWAFGSTEAFNDRHCIATGETTLLSPTDTVGNCGFISCFSMGCSGGHPGMAWKWFTRTGVVSGGDNSDVGKGDTCAPYPFPACAHHVTGSPFPACPAKEYKTPEIGSKCSEASFVKEYSSDKRKAATSYSLSSVEKIQQDMVQYGSVTAAFTVYADFPAYKTGVYKHVSGKQLGGHAIKIIGWGTENGQDYWTVANSWNPSWGDHGTFKIARGTNECGIEGMVSAGTVASPVLEETEIIV